MWKIDTCYGVRAVSSSTLFCAHTSLVSRFSPLLSFSLSLSSSYIPLSLALSLSLTHTHHPTAHSCAHVVSAEKLNAADGRISSRCSAVGCSLRLLGKVRSRLPRSFAKHGSSRRACSSSTRLSASLRSEVWKAEHQEVLVLASVYVQLRTFR